jgi:hypothetical protein
VKTALFPTWHGMEVARWAGRTTAILIGALWLTFAIGEGVPNILKQPSGVIWQFASLMVMFAGYAAGWRNERLGGVVSLAGWMAFYVVNVADVGRLPGPAFALMAVPGVLYLVAWRMARRDLFNNPGQGI